MYFFFYCNDANFGGYFSDKSWWFHIANRLKQETSIKPILIPV